MSHVAYIHLYLNIHSSMPTVKLCMNEWTNREVIRTRLRERERERGCYQNSSINHCNWWNGHQCVCTLITPLGLGVTHHSQEQVLVSLTAHSSSGCSSVNICCFSANCVCFYNQRWSALHHAKEKMLGEEKQTWSIIFF